MSNHCSDSELIQQFMAGKHSGIVKLIKRHKDKVFSYILINVKNHQLAEDVFQDTFYKVIDSLKAGKYKDEGRFASWVMRIAHNLIIDHYRKENKLRTVSNSDNEDYDLFNTPKFSEKNIESRIIESQISLDIKKLVNELPDEQREIIILRHYVGMSFKEIADHTGVSINTALGRMRYALINLRRLIKEKDLILTNF
ncbi:MAG: RNA polymerase subunit sigma-24 [Bacteroidetes bacterium GWF2_38_335]|nr:MAG: RNA polymerase subunit sigma-24 [Bacteroidetes bacterium GWF2_38_335]OFY77840.1 MAG: RNA polymerase subunit sigma-24 [Bacteroidetes bacterium RIFOXYA12_FULL_38_20]HBS87352.1 RNA polymerase subunit sigma-24 [Bacteroidales bacterium]